MKKLSKDNKKFLRIQDGEIRTQQGQNSIPIHEIARHYGETEEKMKKHLLLARVVKPHECDINFYGLSFDEKDNIIENLNWYAAHFGVYLRN